MEKDGEDVLRGTCDLCGEASDGNLQECNILSCTFAQCKEIIYHQSCLDKFLRSNKLDKSRKTGFKCPRGCGKGSQYQAACPGRIDKSHPIFPRNETKKQHKVVPVETGKAKKDAAPVPAAATPVAAAATLPIGKASKHAKPEEAKKDPLSKTRTAAAAGTSTAPTIAMQPAAAPAANGAMLKQQLLEAKAAARRDLGLERGEPTAGSMAFKPPLPVPAPGPPAWAKGVPAVMAPPPPVEAPPALHTLAHYPQLQQLMQAAGTTKQAKPAAAVAAAAAGGTAASTSTAQPAALPLQNQQHFPPVQLAAASSSTSTASVRQPTSIPAHVADQAAMHGQLQRTASGAAAAQTSAQAQQQPPPPPPPPPPRGAAAASTLLPASSAASTSTAPAAAAAAAGGPGPAAAAAAAAGGLPVGMEYAEEEHEDPTKLTKAQKKNLKRAERKKKALLEPDPADSVSHASGSEADATRDLERAERATIMEEMFVQALVCRKTLSVLQDLQRLAFQEWQGAAAVQRYGNDLLAGVAWLLEQDDVGVEEMAARSAEATNAPLPVVDVTDELRQLREVQSGLGLPMDSVQSAVVETSGYVPQAIELLLDQARSTSLQEPGRRQSQGGAVCQPHADRHALWSMQSDPVADVSASHDSFTLGGQGSGLANGLYSYGLHRTASQVHNQRDSLGGGSGSARLSTWAFAGAQQGESVESASSRGAASSASGRSVAGHSDGGFTFTDWVPSQRSTVDSPAVSLASPQPSSGFGGLISGSHNLFGGFP